MALTIETGAGVAGANSYISVTDARAYASARGLTLPAAGVGTDPLEALLIKACDYIEALRGEFQGTKVTKDQALQWPRDGAVVDGYDVDTDEIPAILPLAQAQLACDCYARSDALLMPSGDGREVVRERVEGAVDVQYSPGSGNNPQPEFTAARALLAPLLISALSGGQLGTVRV